MPMAGVSKLTITENAAELKLLLQQQKTASGKERVQLLYLLKSGQATSITQVAALLGRNRVSVQRWAAQYRRGGLVQMLSPQGRGGRKRHIGPAADAQLQQRLQQPTGLSSYKAAREWLEQHCGTKASYAVVHHHIRYRLQAKLKVARRVSVEQDPQAIEQFKKNCPSS